ncbi:MAG: hypothetical protein H7202_12545 [Pedobacter sp.]|nr:hypothetical protein [Pedobacter sp.]
MDDSLEKLMLAKTDDELLDYLMDIKDYSANEVRLALFELKKRGKYFNELQWDYFQQVIKSKEAEESPDTPSYYPRQSLFIYAMLLPMLFAYVVFSLNLKNRRDKWVIIGFAITYTIFMITLGNRLNMPARIPILFNFIGAFVLEIFLWNRYIGKNVLYKNRSMLAPILIALGIWIPLILLSLYLEFG